MKRVLSLTFSLMMALMLTCSVWADDSDVAVSGNWKYTNNLDGTIALIGTMEKMAGYVEMPAVLDGKTITEISGEAFADCAGMISIKVPEGVTTIENDAFRNCEKLSSIFLPSTIHTIQRNAFSGVQHLEAVYYWCTYDQWQTVESQGAFRSFSSDGFRAGSLSFYDEVFVYKNWICAIAQGLVGNKVEAVVNILGALDCDAAVGEVVVPAKINGMAVSQVDVSRFKEMTSVTLPNTLGTIAPSQFDSCTKLQEIRIDGEMDMFKTVDGVLFYVTSGALPGETVGDWNLIAYPNAKPEAIYQIPENVVYIGGYGSTTFGSNNQNLEKILVPKNVKEISSYAFLGVKNLKHVYYAGTEAEWDAISIGAGNDPLLSATIHFNMAELPTVAPGDVTGDDKINNRDAVRIMQYLAGWDVEFVEAAADVNGDGKVNNRDAVRLLQYLAGWDVEIQ